MNPILLILWVGVLACTALHPFDKVKKSIDKKYFTGIIEYQYSYESNVLNSDSLKRVKPFKSLFRYDNNDYQSQFIGQDTLTYYYSGKLNTCLSQTNSQQNYECEDYGILTDSIIYFKVYDADEKVIGHPCKIVEFQTNYFWNKYYISADLKIAPDTYQKHLAYNWSFYGDKADGGLILKLEHRFKNYTMKGIVVELKKFEDNFNALEIGENLIEEVCIRNKK